MRPLCNSKATLSIHELMVGMAQTDGRQDVTHNAAS